MAEGGWSGFASKIADITRDFTNLHTGPTLTRRTALAEAEAAKIKAESDSDKAIVAAKTAAEIAKIATASEVENAKLRYDAVKKLIEKEERRLKIRNSIVDQAMAEPPPNEVSEESPKEDWLYQFFEYCQDVSDSDMQQIWAKLLAGEFAKPSSFSLHALSIVKLLRREDADLFTRLCRYAWHRNGILWMPIVGAPERIFDLTPDLNFEDLNHLASLSLINYTGSPISQRFPQPRPAPLAVSYFSQNYCIIPDGIKLEILLTLATFTSVGKELATIAGAEPDEEYRERVLRMWQGQSFMVAGPLDNQIQ